MEWIAYVVAVVFCLLGALCVGSVMFGLPGTWILLALAGLVEFADRAYLPEGARQTFDWRLLGLCVVLGLIGELIEFVAGAAGAKTGGASKRGMVGALIGGILGALLFSVPVPVIGTLIGAALGSFIGAVVGEVSGAQPKTVAGSVKPAIGATIGRVVGTLGKLMMTIVIWAALSVAAFV